MGRRLPELSKCQVLCRKCHLQKTMFEDMKYPLQHGANRYKKGCRCDVCREANTISRREYRRRTGRR